MVRIFNGTTANDSFVGDLLDINIFNGIGIGSDRPSAAFGTIAS